ncbi:MAG: exo-alpha-sialidase [Pirellulaceae bacterium]|nr:exo-alpha-sialidase [Pirellulaceae bacterium]
MQADLSKVPGIVVHHSAAGSGLYVGSPGIAVLDDGAYLAKCDLFGPNSNEFRAPATLVFRSENRGRSWRQVARLEGLFWASVFTHRGTAWMLGTDKHHGRIVILRSDDGGRTWTKPIDADTGLLTPDGEYHTAPVPVVVHQGRVWRACEDAMGGKRWGERYRAFVMSAPVDADLLKSSSWTFSNRLVRDPEWLEGRFGGWLEGNVVAAPDGRIVNILRVETKKGEQAAMIHVGDDGRATFDPRSDFLDFPGGATKFTIRDDPSAKRYWALTNYVLPKFSQFHAGCVRNTLALIGSDDLKNWKIHCLLLHHPDHVKHAFQYPDWVFDGEDIIAVVRAAFDDGLGGAHNAHDANFLIFHRFKNFRRLTMADSVMHIEE